MLCHVQSPPCNDLIGMSNQGKRHLDAFAPTRQTLWDSTFLSYLRVAPGLWLLCGGAWFRQRQDQEHSWVLQRGNKVDDAF
jgi:hypothetical protein